MCFVPNYGYAIVGGLLNAAVDNHLTDRS